MLVVDAGRAWKRKPWQTATPPWNGFEVVPGLNNIDLPVADPERVAEEIEDIVGIDATTRCAVQRKPALACRTLNVWCAIFAAGRRSEGPLQALMIDSWFDTTWRCFTYPY
ncbi:hypothetical protein ACNKHR_20445 [Shigella flexneri]